MFCAFAKSTLIVCWASGALALAGCASSGSSAAISSPPKQAITVIRSETFRFDWDKEIRPVRSDLERCAANAIEEHFPELRYVSRVEFARTAFPNLPIDSAPTSLNQVRVLLENTIFLQRLKPLNLRYIVYVGGHTEIEGAHYWEVIGGYMAATVIGYSKWEKDTDVSALLFDLQAPLEVVSVEGHTEGTSWVAGLFPLFIGMPDSTESNACSDIGEQLVSTLAAAKDLEVHQ